MNKKLICLIILINMIIFGLINAKSNKYDEQARYKKTTKKSLGKIKTIGVYDEKKHEELIPLEVFEESNKESEQTKEKLKTKLSFREIDKDGNEYEYELDENEIEEIVKRGKTLLTESSIAVQQAGETQAGNEDPNEEEEDDEHNRRLAIIGADTRVEITSSTSSPYKQIGLLTFSDSTGASYICSAALIAPQHILTAGHCVHEGSGGNWFTNFNFYPGRTRYVGSVTGYYYPYTNVLSFNGWTASGNYDYDMAVIKLGVSPGIGYLSFGYDTGISTSYRLYLAGYPADKPYGTMWRTDDYISNIYTDQLFTDESDTYGGHSGAACYFYPSYLTYLRIFAAHSGSNTYSSGVTLNRHTRITSSKYTTICTWMNTPSVC